LKVSHPCLTGDVVALFPQLFRGLPLFGDTPEHFMLAQPAIKEIPFELHSRAPYKLRRVPETGLAHRWPNGLRGSFGLELDRRTIGGTGRFHFSVCCTKPLGQRFQIGPILQGGFDKTCHRSRDGRKIGSSGRFLNGDCVGRFRAQRFAQFHARNLLAAETCLEVVLGASRAGLCVEHIGKRRPAIGKLGFRRGLGCARRGQNLPNHRELLLRGHQIVVGDNHIVGHILVGTLKARHCGKPLRFAGIQMSAPPAKVKDGVLHREPGIDGWIFDHGIAKRGQRLGKRIDESRVAEEGSPDQARKVLTARNAYPLGSLLRPFPGNPGAWIVGLGNVDQLFQTIEASGVDGCVRFGRSHRRRACCGSGQI
jgi:hypothetical protein